MSKWDFECKNAIFGPSSNDKIGFRMSKYDMIPQFECQNRISSVHMRYSASVRMSKYDFEFQNTIFSPIRMLKYDFECQNAIFGSSSNVK